MLTLCEPQALGHIQVTCKSWKQQCRLRLTQLELPPQPTAELQTLAAALPSIKRIRFKYKYKQVLEFDMHAPQMRILKDFSLLTSLAIEGQVYLRAEALDSLEDSPDLSGLQVLSLPAADSLPQEITKSRLPESLTALSITGMKLDPGCWNWPPRLSAIQTVSVQCCFLYHNKLDYRCLYCMICAPNIRSVNLSIDYSQNSVNVLRALSKLILVYSHPDQKTGQSADPQLGCCPGDWLLTLTSVSCLDLFALPALVCIAAVNMTWLSALSMSAQGHQFGTASTMSSLAQLTRLTSLILQGPALGNVQVTFLHYLADLAVCDLDASWQGLRTCEHHFKELRHGYQAMFGLSALTPLSLSASYPLGPDPKLSAIALNTNLQSVECLSLHLVSNHFIKTVANLTCLTSLRLSGSQLPITLLGLSCLRWLKELVLFSREVSHTNMGFVCSLRYLALLKLQKIAFRDTVFAQSEKLDKLTSLMLSNCPLVTSILSLL